MALLDFDANTVEPRADFSIVSGDYKAMIISSEMKPTKDNPENEYLLLNWEVIDGDYKGCRIFDRLNLKNTKQDAAKIAYQTLSSICHAVGLMKVKDSSELHEKPCMIKIVIEESNGFKSPRIKKYSSLKNAEKAEKEEQGTKSAKPPWIK